MKRAAKVFGIATVVLAIYAVAVYVINHMLKQYICYESNNGYDEDCDFFEDKEIADEDF